MTTFDDGIPVQPGDVVRDARGRVYYRLVPHQSNSGNMVVWRDVEDGQPRVEEIPVRPLTLLVSKTSPEPRPPLPTHLGAVVWVGGEPHMLGIEGTFALAWRNAFGARVLTDWLAGQDWTTTPPGAS